MNKSLLKINNKAFSLIEVLLYLSLVVIVIGGVMTFSQEIFDISGKAKIINDVDYESNYALNKLANYIKESKAINSPIFSQADNTISLQDTNNKTIFIKLINNQIKISFDGINYIPLTSNKIIINDLKFTNLGMPNTNGLIKINFIANNKTENTREIYNFVNNYQIYATPRI
jgi:hypothetical protein